MIASIILFIYLLNRIALYFKVFKLMAFLTYFILLFFLLNVDFIHTNTILYTNFYTNFATKELCLTSSLVEINDFVHWLCSSLLYFGNDFLKNAAKNFNFNWGYTICMLISIICKSFNNKSPPNVPFYSFIFVTLIILKATLETKNSDTQS